MNDTDGKPPMSESGARLVELFRAVAPGLSFDGEELAALEAALTQGIQAAAAMWPQVVVPTAPFMAFLAERVVGRPDPIDQLVKIRFPDLYLICGCALGLPEAIAQFEQTVAPALDAPLERLGLHVDRREDLKQSAFEKLFLGSGGRPPQIVHYTGEGRFVAWYRVVGTRLAIDDGRRRWREHPMHDDLLPKVIADEDGPELRFLKQEYRREFKAAFGEALATLDDRERTVLGYRVMGRASSARISEVYGVHEATVRRWLQSAREKLLDGTRAKLEARLRLDGDEFRSVVRLIESNLDVSLPRLLGGDGGDSEGAD